MSDYRDKDEQSQPRDTREMGDRGENRDFYRTLYDKALAISENAYAPYSNFKVGAALLGKSGKIYRGVNVENSSYGAAICAERNAITTAVTEGERAFIALAVASASGEAVPCGICRQFLSEFGTDIDIITCAESKLRVVKLKDYLPAAFVLVR